MEGPATFALRGGKITTTPIGGPLDVSPPPHIVTAIGAAISSFARLEYMVTVIGLHVNKHAADAILYKRDPNSKFPEMLRLVRKWMSCHSAYKQARTSTDDFFYGELQKDTDFRNDLAHAFLHSFDPVTGDAELRSIRRTGKETWEHRAIDTGLIQIKALADQANLATRHFVEIAKLIFDDDQPPQT